MDRLWAPWRLAYVEAPKVRDGSEPCFICRGLGENNDRDNLIVQRSAHVVVLLNRFPYNNGHLLVAPNAHRGHPGDLDDEEILQSSRAINQMLATLDRLMRPDGYNIGL